MMATKKAVFLIGDNEAGIRSKYDKLTIVPESNDKEIEKIFCGGCQSIYANNNLTKMWTSGSNGYGQCGINSKSQLIMKLTPIEYFNNNKIKINKISLSTFSCNALFISDDHKLYACGSNEDHQLGWNEEEISLYESQRHDDDTFDKSQFNKYLPELIPDLNNVIDVKSSMHYNVAICLANNKQILTIITFWCRINNLSNDILNLLILFTKISTIYTTQNSDKFENKYGWNEIISLRNKNIIKIGCGHKNSFYLDYNGNLYGLRHGNEPGKMKWFKDNGVNVIDIVCGECHFLALSDKGRVYSWGYNQTGQCGLGHNNYVWEPHLIEAIKEYVVKEIKCSAFHSYVKTECGKHFIFGKNSNGECLKSKNNDGVLLPYRIDCLIEEQCNSDNFKVYLGRESTKIVCDIQNAKQDAKL